MNYKIKIDKILNYIIIILITFMPLHTQVCEYLIPGGLDNLWRDILLILGILITLLYKKGNFIFGKYGLSIFLMWVVCILYTLFAENMNPALNMGRTYLMPTLIYFIVINSDIRSKTILNIISITATILAVWGIFQAFILKDTFLVNLGYPSIDGHLSSSSFYISGFFGIQRVTSTFASPNIAGCYFGMALIVMSYIPSSTKLYLMKIIVAVALITTFSRSAILATVLVLIIKDSKNKDFTVLLRKAIIFIPFCCIVLYFADVYYFNGIVLKMISSSIHGVSSGTDASFQKHASDLTEITNIINHPFGLGFGNNGPMANGPFANKVESSIYLLAYDFGIIGMLVFIYPYAMESVGFILGNRKISNSICACFLVTYLVLPNIETYELIFFAFMFIGLSYKVEIKNDLNCQVKCNTNGLFL